MVQCWHDSTFAICIAVPIHFHLFYALVCRGQSQNKIIFARNLLCKIVFVLYALYIFTLGFFNPGQNLRTLISPFSLRFFRVWLMFINMYALLPLMLRHGRAALTAMVIPCPQLHMNSIKRAHKDTCSLFKVLCNSPLHGAKLPGNAAGTLANCFPCRPM